MSYCCCYCKCDDSDKEPLARDFLKELAEELRVVGRVDVAMAVERCVGRYNGDMDERAAVLSIAEAMQ